MDRTAIRDALIAALRTIAPEVDGAALRPDRPLRDQVELDSMDFLNLLIRLHERLGVDIADADAARLVTPDDFVDYLEARLR